MEMKLMMKWKTYNESVLSATTIHDVPHVPRVLRVPLLYVTRVCIQEHVRGRVGLRIQGDASRFRFCMAFRCRLVLIFQQ